MTSKYVVKGSDFPSEIVADKCASQYRAVVKKKKIPLDATGDRVNMMLVHLLQCQVKSTKHCQKIEKEYSLCHKSFMGMGSYKGKHDCAEQLSALYRCVTLSSV